MPVMPHTCKEPCGAKFQSRHRYLTHRAECQIARRKRRSVSDQLRQHTSESTRKRYREAQPTPSLHAKAVRRPLHTKHTTSGSDLVCVKAPAQRRPRLTLTRTRPRPTTSTPQTTLLLILVRPCRRRVQHPTSSHRRNRTVLAGVALCALSGISIRSLLPTWSAASFCGLLPHIQQQ